MRNQIKVVIFSHAGVVKGAKKRVVLSVIFFKLLSKWSEKSSGFESRCFTCGNSLTSVFAFFCFFK